MREKQRKAKAAADAIKAKENAAEEAKKAAEKAAAGSGNESDLNAA